MRQHPKRLLAVLTVAAVAITIHTASAVDVYTDPVGFITVTAVGTNGAAGKGQTFVGLGMTQLPVQRGLVGTANTNQIVAGTGAGSWTNNQFNGGNGPHEIEITTGTNAGLIDSIVATVAPNIIYTESGNAALISSGNKFLIRPSWTLAKAFGPANEAGFATTDQIIVPNPANNTFPTYFYSTGGKAGVGWRSTTAGSVDQGNVPLFIEQGMVVKKTTGTNLLVKLIGAVKLGKTIVPVAGSGTNTFVGNVYASSAMTLTNSGLYTGTAATGLTSTDFVVIHNPDLGTAGFTEYFWSTGGKAGIGWRSTTGGSVDQGSTPIPLGASVIVKRGVGNGAFNWFAQAPYTP